MAAYALHLATPVVTSDLASERRFADLFLRKLDVHSAISIPLYSTTEPFGALGVYTRKQRVFTLDDVSFAETMAHLLTSSITRIKAEEALHEERAISSTISAAVDTLVMTLDAQGNVVSLNRACQQATGFSTEEIRGRPFCSVFAVSNEVDMVEGMFRRAVVEKMASHLQSCLFTKQGTRRHMFWSAQPICGENGSVRAVVLSGADLTDQLETFAQLHQATTTLDHLRKKLCADVCEENPTPDLLAASCKSTQVDTIRPQDERRRRPRQAYRFGQLIAPVRDLLLPPKQEFFEVVCENISVGGILFYLAAAPDFKDLVVALGKPAFRMYIAARVAWVMEKMSDGRTVYQVGCRFTGRLPLEAMDFSATFRRHQAGQ
jgi:PAS domain S-box-containing protein